MIHSRTFFIYVFFVCAMALVLSGCGREEAPDSRQQAVDAGTATSADRKSADVAATEKTASPPPRRAPATSPDGIYLTDGGLGYFLIDRDEKGALRGDGFLMGGDIFRVTPRGANLIIESRIINPMFDIPADEKLWGGYMELAPSATAPGDWDLKRLRDPEVLLALEAKASSIIDPEPIKASQLPDPEAWDVPSFLHRLDDARAVEYFEYVDDYRDSPEIFTRANALLTDHPDDPWVRILYLDACVRTEAMEEFGSHLTEWKSFYDSIAQPEIRWNLQQAGRVMLTHQRTAAGRNAWDYITTRLMAPEADLAARLVALPSLMNYDFCDPPYTSLMSQEQGDMIRLPILASIFTTQSTLQLLKGDFNESRATQIAAYHQGWLLEQGTDSVSLLTGMTLRAYTMISLETLALNAPLSPVSICEANWQAISALPDVTPLSDDGTDRKIPLAMPGFITSGTQKEYSLRTRVTNARLANLKAAAALRLYQAQTGTFPAPGVVMLENLTDWRMPDDPFTSGPLRLAHDATSQTLTVYSLGPDGEDDGGAISYDPTNGTVSGGDVRLRIPAEREMPFPAGGVRAADGADLRRQFPNGLPRDVFSDTRSPLSITDAAPVRVWSWGPDTNESEATPGQFKMYSENAGSTSIQTENGFFKLDDLQSGTASTHPPYIPTIQYDPTNGVVSAGDIFIELPAP